MKRADMPLGEIAEVKERRSAQQVNILLKEGKWVLLDAKVGQGESGSFAYYILGRRVGMK